MSARNPVFDYRALRLLMGSIALTLPFSVSILANSELSSISAAYHTDARNAFVGLLFIVAAFLWAYNGHTDVQSVASKIAAIAAIVVAVVPTTCDTCHVTPAGKVHFTAAIVLFSILTFFAWVRFRRQRAAKVAKPVGAAEFISYVAV